MSSIIPGYNYDIFISYRQKDNKGDRWVSEFVEALEIRKKWGMKATWIYNYISLGEAYHKTRKYREEKKIYKKASLEFQDDPLLLYMEAVLALDEGKSKDAKKYIEKYKAAYKEHTASEAAIASGLAGIYSEAGILDKAEDYCRQALSMEPENPSRLNGLAWILIDNDINIKEGIGLIEKAIELNPDNYLYLDTKGWGLFKQEKYKEALDLLEKAWTLKPVYDHEVFLHLEAAKKAVAGQKNNTTSSSAVSKGITRATVYPGHGKPFPVEVIKKPLLQAVSSL